ncbi:MAG: VWA domain-containing protein [Ardenticatenia bacterium]|nr:VWA domain-containing protein [Ardenticatenia bacterium]
MSRHRAGLVSFSDLASLDQPLTADGGLARRLDSIRSDGSTDIGTALERAQDHLAEAGRPGPLVLLLMTDGKPTRDGQPYIDALRTAARARGRGAWCTWVGLGDDVVTELLVAIAATPSATSSPLRRTS